MLREFTDAVLALLERHTALRPDPAWVDVAVAGSALFLVLLSLITGIAKLRARLRRVPAAQKSKPDAPPAVSALAAAMMAPPPAPAPRAHTAPTATARETAVPETPVGTATPAAEPKLSAQPSAPGDSTPARREDHAAKPNVPDVKRDTKPETAPPALTAQQRKDLALALRDAVLAKVAEGGWFKDGAEPLTYRFNRVSLTRMQYEILLELPSPGGAPRAGHALHVTVDGRKKLNLEWGTGANAAARVRFLSPGDWTTAITSWNFADNRPPVVTPQPARKRA